MTVQVVRADNASILTLDGTRSYVVGNESVVVIDPGPRDPAQLGRIEDVVRGRPVIAILLTHAHGDHAGCGATAAARFEAPVRASTETLQRVGIAGQALEDGDRICWDDLELVAIRTPGHSSDHLSYLLLPERDVFTGDLVLGTGTSVILYPDGDLSAYLASLGRLAALRPNRLWPGHGDPVSDGEARLAEYRQHRLERSRQILEAVAAGARDVSAIRRVVYGDLAPGLEGAANASVSAHLEALRRDGRDVPAPAPGFRFAEEDG